MKSFSKITKTLLVSILIGMIGCTSLPKPPLTPPQADQRDRLMFEELMSQSDREINAVHNAYFMPVGDWKPALHELAGTLNVPETPMQTDIWKHRLSRSAPRYFPGFSVQFFTHKGHLVPVERNIIQPVEGNPRSSWNLILSPGKVWSEPADNGMSRASFLKIGGSFFFHIILDRGYPISRYLIPMRAAALFFNIDQTSFKIHIRKINASNRRPLHAGFYQRVTDGLVTPGSVAFSLQPFLTAIVVPIFGSPAD